MKRFMVTAVAALTLVGKAFAVPVIRSVDNCTSTTDCDRDCMTVIVRQVLDSMLAHDPSTLPLAQIYNATENSHPAALSMMTSWRTITEAGAPNLLAIDTTVGSAYFALDISESGSQSVLWARIQVVNKQITQLEIYINRSRGDHGFSFSPSELPTNYLRWMNPPADRQVATRAQLEDLSAATFNPSYNFNVTVDDNCQFTEEGWHVVDPGPNLNGSYTPLGCSWPTGRPIDLNARLDLVIDEEYGIVVTGAVIPGKVYPYGNLSAFIPNQMTQAQEAQDTWLRVTLAEGNSSGLLDPSPATGETLQVLQYYDNKLQGQQVMLYLSPPGAHSDWRQ